MSRSTLTTDAGIAIAVRPARTWRARAQGLIAAYHLAPAEGMLFMHCRSVHTWLMAYPIDVAYLDDELHVVKVARMLQPWRFSAGGRRARHTLELNAGEASRLGLAPGVTLTLHAGGSS